MFAPRTISILHHKPWGRCLAQPRSRPAQRPVKEQGPIAVSSPHPSQRSSVSDVRLAGPILITPPNLILCLGFHPRICSWPCPAYFVNVYNARTWTRVFGRAIPPMKILACRPILSPVSRLSHRAYALRPTARCQSVVEVCMCVTRWGLNIGAPTTVTAPVPWRYSGPNPHLSTNHSVWAVQ